MKNIKKGQKISGYKKREDLINSLLDIVIILGLLGIPMILII